MTAPVTRRRPRDVGSALPMLGAPIGAASHGDVRS
jgi:hypothetical protein